MPKKKEDMDFAKAFAELEGIAAWFETGSPDLEAGLAQYERAMVLTAMLKTRLTQAENRVKEIRSSHTTV